MRGVDQDPVRPHPRRDGPVRLRGDEPDHVGHHVGVGGPVRAGPRRHPAGVRAHQPDPVLGGDTGQFRVYPAPDIVQQVRAGQGDGLPHLGPPGVDADDHGGVPFPYCPDQRGRAPDLLGDVHLVAGPGLHPANVDDAGARGHRPAGRRQGGAELHRGPLVVERIGGGVDHGHDRERARRPFLPAKP
jgi:hypothetical protein